MNRPATIGLVKPSVLPGFRVYAIGDIHGRYDLLAEKFAAIEANERELPARRSILITLGDYIDRGRHSREVIDLLANPPPDLTFYPLAGNHEVLFLQFLSGEVGYHEWKNFGGRETLLSYGVSPAQIDALARGGLGIETIRQQIPPSHIAFLNRLWLCFKSGDYFFAHAGIRPGVALDKQKLQDLLWIRDEFLAADGDHGKIIVHGHTPVAMPEFRANRINIDTGAYITGRLTCLVLEEDSVRIL